MAANLSPPVVTNLSASLQDDQSQPAATFAAHERRLDDDHDHPSEPEDVQPFSEYSHVHLTLDRGADTVTLKTSPLQELEGSIELDRSRVNVGETVGVVWNVRGVDSRFLNHMDFLGLFEVTEGEIPVEIDNLIDSKLRGFNSSQSGRVNWLIQPDHLHGRMFVM